MTLKNNTSTPSWSNNKWCMILLGYTVAMVIVMVDTDPQQRGHRSVVTTTRVVQNCSDTQKRCMAQLGCSMAINNYLMHCSPLIQGDTTQCLSKCKMALLALLSTDSHAGQDINTCNCQGNEFCVLQRSRLQVCQKEVMSSMSLVTDEETPVSCSLALMMCAADTSCFTALSFYREHCRKLVRGEKCTSKCNNSLAILYRQPKASKLRNCICDGEETGGDCLTMKNNTETLCFGNKRSRHRVKNNSTSSKSCKHHHSHHGNRTECHHHRHHDGGRHDKDGRRGDDDSGNMGDIDNSVDNDPINGNSPLTSSGREDTLSVNGRANQNLPVTHILFLSCVALAMLLT